MFIKRTTACSCNLLTLTRLRMNIYNLDVYFFLVILSNEPKHLTLTYICLGQCYLYFKISV